MQKGSGQAMLLICIEMIPKHGLILAYNGILAGAHRKSKARLYSGVLRVEEKEIGGVCFCLCCYDVKSTIAGLAQEANYLLTFNHGGRHHESTRISTLG
jgi:hypothetical protein